MNPGELRELIEVQKPQETQNALGEVTQTWVTFATRYASVSTLSSKQALSAMQQGLTITHKIKLRSLDGLNDSYRIRWRNRTLQIISLLELEYFTVTELLCEEKAD